MNNELNSILDIVFQLGFCAVGLGGFFLLIGFFGHYGIIAVLIATVFLFFMIWLLYYLHPRLFPDTPFRELSESEKEDHQEFEIIVDRPYSEIFDLCMQVLQSFDSVMIDDFNPSNGTLSARTPVRIFTRYGYAQSIITIKIQSIGTAKTSVKITSICEKFSFPTRGKNLENITRIRTFISNPQSPLIMQNVHDGYVSSKFENSPKEWLLKNPEIAAKLSIIPGLGHIYTGQYQKGILLGLITILLIFIPFSLAFSGLWCGGSLSFMNDLRITLGNGLIIILGFLPVILLWIYSIFDSRESAKKVNSGLFPFKPTRHDILFLYILIIIVLVILMVSIMIFVLPRI